MNKDSIVLGSGNLYVKEFKKGSEIPQNSEIEKEDNRLGYISGGCTVEYAPEFYEAKDDMGKVSKSIITNEVVNLKTGLITWCGKTLEKLCSTARVSEAAGKRTVKIGGVGNQKNDLYLIHFVHEDKEDGAIRVTIVGNNQAGFSFAFAKDKETTIDAEFSAKPMDTEGTLLLYEEEDATIMAMV